MSPETIFLICNNVVLPGWILLIFAPKWKWTGKLVDFCVIPFILSLVYAGLIIANINLSELDFTSLAGVEKLFRNQYILVAGWVHYLAFDLFVGGWILRNSLKLKIPHYFLVPCLLLTFMFGPIGFAIYCVIRFIKSNPKNIETEEKAQDSELTT